LGWLQGLVLGLLEALTASEQGSSIATVVDMGNPGLEFFGAHFADNTNIEE
jgi:hypothetical protein